MSEHNTALLDQPKVIEYPGGAVEDHAIPEMVPADRVEAEAEPHLIDTPESYVEALNETDKAMVESAAAQTVDRYEQLVHATNKRVRTIAERPNRIAEAKEHLTEGASDQVMAQGEAIKDTDDHPQMDDVTRVQTLSDTLGRLQNGAPLSELHLTSLNITVPKFALPGKKRAVAEAALSARLDEARGQAPA